jgi:RNA polymerase sigma-70 factor (ECF subfamily)
LKLEIQQNLIDRANDGDIDAFTTIYLLLKDSIYGFAYRMTNQTPIAEEIVQEVFVFFIENPEKYRSDRGSLFSFLCGIARNKILNHLKKCGTKLEKNNFEDRDLEVLIKANGNSPLKDLLTKEFSEKVEQSVGELSPFQREVLILREMEDLSYREISEVTKSDIGVVKGRLYRARRSLARELAPYMESKEVKTYELRKS